MTTQDSGLIDLFAMHEEAKAEVAAPPPVPSAPPPGVSFDIGDDDAEEIFAAAQRQSQKRMKLVGGALAGLGILAVLIGVMAGGETKASQAAAAAPPPSAPITAIPTAAPVPPPVVPAPAPPVPAEEKGKPEYTKATAAAAYAAASGQQPANAGKRKPARGSKGGGIKLQKVQSSGTGS